MKIIITIFLSLCFVSTSPSQKRCSCKAPEPNEETHSGGNEIITVIESKPFKSVRGIARDVNGEPLAGVLVELFNKPNWILKDEYAAPEKQRRIAVCKTNADGSFCFADIKAGTYELRGSINLGWNPTHMYIKVAPKNPKARKRIQLRMTVGT